MAHALLHNSYSHKFTAAVDHSEHQLDKLLVAPDYVSEHFAVLLKRHGLRKIRFHDLRHSCASTMLALGKQMKDIQMWLGHSDIGTTGNIYSHLDSHSKVQTGAAIYDALTD